MNGPNQTQVAQSSSDTKPKWHTVQAARKALNSLPTGTANGPNHTQVAQSPSIPKPKWQGYPANQFYKWFELDSSGKKPKWHKVQVA